MNAYDEGDKDLIEKSINAFKANVRQKAKTIRKELFLAPYTTDFAVMFLPTEPTLCRCCNGQPGVFESLQRDHQIVVTGPSTLAAFVQLVYKWDSELLP